MDLNVFLRVKMVFELRGNFFAMLRCALVFQKQNNTFPARCLGSYVDRK